MRIRQTFQVHAGRVTDVIGQIAKKTADAETKRRYQHPFLYIAENGMFPNPMSAMRAPNGLHFVDGHHRLAAFTNLQNAPEAFYQQRKLKRPSLRQSVWLGTHAKGELPLA